MFFFFFLLLFIVSFIFLLGLVLFLSFSLGRMCLIMRLTMIKKHLSVVDGQDRYSIDRKWVISGHFDLCYYTFLLCLFVTRVSVFFFFYEAPLYSPPLNTGCDLDYLQMPLVFRNSKLTCCIFHSMDTHSMLLVSFFFSFLC